MTFRQPSRREFLTTTTGAALALGLSGCVYDRTFEKEGASTPAASSGFDLGKLAKQTFQWFWDVGDHKTGLVPDRWPTKSFASIASVGFALAAYPIGVSRGWITRAQARERTLNTMRFFDTAPQGPEATGKAGHKGFFYHFLKMEDGTRFGKTELSSVDTALLLGGVLFAAQWFDGGDAQETEIRTLAERIYSRVDWQWMYGQGPFVSMGWHPEKGFIKAQWNIYNEAMLLQILALAAPRYPLNPEMWGRLTKNFDERWGTHWGEDHLHFGPLFGHQYSHMFIDFRGIQDDYIRARGIDYFENSRRAVKAQRNYAIENAGDWAGYSENVWGLTACDGPGDFKQVEGGKERQFFSYSARGPGDRDDGTIAPTAAAASIAFAPELVMPCLAEMERRYGAGIIGEYGFWDSFNPTLTKAPAAGLRHGKIVDGVGWVDGDYIGIDQGPILGMIANHEQDFIWKTMRQNKHIITGLKRAGFKGGWLDGVAG